MRRQDLSFCLSQRSDVSVQGLTSDDFHGSPMPSKTSSCLYEFKECLAHFTMALLSDSLFESITCGQETNNQEKLSIIISFSLFHLKTKH